MVVASATFSSTALVYLWRPPLVSRWYPTAAPTVITSGTSISSAVVRCRLLFCSTSTRSPSAEAYFEHSTGLGRPARLAFRPPSRVERVALVVGTVPAPRSRPPPLLGRSCVFRSRCGCRCAADEVGGLSLLALFAGLAAIHRPR